MAKTTVVFSLPFIRALAVYPRPAINAYFEENYYTTSIGIGDTELQTFR